MKIFISVDIEGVAGVCEPLQGQRGNAEYETARHLMTQEANAAICGAFDAGATEITVADSHGPMRNMIVEDLDPRARVVSGKPRPLSMIQGVRPDHDGIVLVGYHAAAGEPGILAHTISGLAFSRIEINGIVAGEPTIFAGYAAELGVPLLAVSGDDKVCGEVAKQFPDTHRIQTKTALGAQASDSLSPSEARKLITEEVREAVRQAHQQQPHIPCKPPLDIKVEFMKQVHADAISLLPHTERLNARSISFSSDTYEQAIGSLSVFALVAQALTPR
ncbi:M55 family metallopeptidase [Roseovarius sp. MMSF_3281]|uniref:M55 family metallopeptidase n=1 Tax=Roseovarius sp. MMSF_3281 TaxID=3046694 RepID=UPI00273EA466|nr:M55 family metallopeptidase [Roseovarius sp. MMSF_3281]